MKETNAMNNSKFSKAAFASLCWLVIMLSLAWPGLNLSAQTSGDVISVAWSPDGTKIVGGGTDGLLRIWDTSGQVILDIPGLTETVSAVSWSPDSTKVISHKLRIGSRCQVSQISQSTG
jgi:WD40 repeat protein